MTSDCSPSCGDAGGENPKMPNNHYFDDLFDRVGSFGRYQFFIAFFVQYSCLMLAGNFYMMVFGTLKPKWSCRRENGTVSEDYCSFKDNCTNDSAGENFITKESDFYSITENFQLVCEQDYVPTLMTSIQMLGQALGNPIGGHLADYFGRKPIFSIGFVTFLASGLLCALAPNWQALTVFMFALGFSFGWYIASSFVLAMELTGKKHRLIMNCCFQWCISFQVVALAAYLTKNWRYYLYAINGVCLPLLALIFFVDESPRWLIQKRRTEKAAKVLNKMAVWNGKSERITNQELELIQLDQHQTAYSFLLLFKTKKLALYSIICILTAFFCACVAGVILFNVDSLAGSPFLNVALYGLLRVWAPPFVIFMELKSSFFGRRPMYLISMLVVIVCFVGIIIIYSIFSMQNAYLTTGPWKIVATVLALTGTCINASILDVATTQYMTELFPTVIRSIAVGTFNVADNLGSVVAPQLIYLKKYWSPLPYVAVALLGAIGWVLAFFVLPETSGKNLADTLNENDTLEDVKGAGETREDATS